MVLVQYRKQSSQGEPYELRRINLKTGALELVGHMPTNAHDLAVHPTGILAAWSTGLSQELYISTIGRNGITNRRLTPGTHPAWSPDGKTLAYMNGQHCVALLDMQSEHSQEIAWFEPPNLSLIQCHYSMAVPPVWSPDGSMLWFTLTQTRKLPYSRSFSAMVNYLYYKLYPFWHNCNPWRRGHFVPYLHTRDTPRTGVVDLPTKRVVITKGYTCGVDWLPDVSASAAHRET